MSEDLPPKPEPHVEEPPEGPGAPADSVPNEPRPPTQTPDQPRSAQVEDENVPDEIDKPEDVDEDDEADAQAKPNAEEPSG